MITLKNVKHSEFASHETNCFEATVYWNGKKAGYAENSGQGGSSTIHWLTPAVRKEAQDWADKQPDIVTDLPSITDKKELFSFPFDLECHVDELLEAHLQEKDMKAKLRTKILIKDDTCGKGDFYAWSIKKYNLTKDELVKKILSCQKFENPIVMNNLPLGEALAIWRS